MERKAKVGSQCPRGAGRRDFIDVALFTDGAMTKPVPALQTKMEIKPEHIYIQMPVSALTGHVMWVTAEMLTCMGNGWEMNS